MVDPQRVQELRAKMQADGVIQPTTVRPDKVQELRAKMQADGVQPRGAAGPLAKPTVKQDPGVFSEPDKPAYDLTGEGLSVENIAKSGANIFKSLIKFGKGVVQSLNPVEVAKNLKEIPGQIVGASEDQLAAKQSQQNATVLENEVKAKTGKKPVASNTSVPGPLKSLTTGTYKSVVPPAVQKFLRGHGTEALQSVAEDPYQLAPAFLALKGGLETKFGTYDPAKPNATGTALNETAAGKAIDSAVSKTARVVTKPAGALAKGAGNAAKATGNFVMSQATGLAPETIKTIKENPSSFSPSEIAKSDRAGVVSDVHGAIQQRLSDLSETGKEYKPIRDSGAPVNIPVGTVEDVLANHGIKVDANGKLQFTKESIPTSPADQSAIQNWYDTYGKDTQHTANSLLNARQASNQLAQFGSKSTDAVNILGRDLYNKLNEVGRPQVRGLEGLDTKYSAEVSELKKIRSEYLNSDGTLKDSASSKIANLTNKGREQALARLEQISPGVTKKIRVLKAIEDIHTAGGQKVGTYTRALIAGAGVATLQPAAIVAAIISNPAVATQLLRAYGATVKASRSVVDSATAELKKSLNTEPSVGLSIEDASLKRKSLQTEWQRLQQQKLKTTDKAAIARIEKAQKAIDEQSSKLRR